MRENQNITGREWAVLGAILLFGLALRSWGLGFGLPNTECKPDESTIALVARGMVLTGNANPHFFDYPSFYLYFTAALYLAIGWVGTLLDAWPSTEAFLLSYWEQPGLFLLPLRLVSVATSTLSIWLTYRVARPLFGAGTALLGAFFLAVAYLPVRESHFGVTDTTQLFLALASLACLGGPVPAPSTQRYVLAGLFAGLAAATKYAGIFLIAPVLVAHTLYWWQNSGRTARSLFCARGPWIFGISLMNTFLACTPYAILDFDSFLRDNRTVFDFTRTGLIHISHRGWWEHAFFSLYYGLGAPLWAVSILGCIWLIWRKPIQTLWFLAFPAAYYLCTGYSLMVFVRYALPMVPFMCVGAGFLVWNVIMRLPGAWLKRACAMSFIAILAGPSLWSVAYSNHLLTRADTRALAREWMLGHLPAGAALCRTGVYFADIQMPVSAGRLEYDLEHAALEWERLDLPQRIERARELGDTGIEPWTYDYEADRFLVRDQPVEGLPEFVLIDQSPLERWALYPRVMPRLEKHINDAYALQMAWEGSAAEAKKNQYAHGDQFYMPYAGFKGVERPGPNLYLFRLRAQETQHVR